MLSRVLKFLIYNISWYNISFLSNQLRIHLISHFVDSNLTLSLRSWFGHPKGNTLQECTNANQLQWWIWTLLSHPSCSARKSYCLCQLRRDRVSNRPRQSIIMLLSNREKTWEKEKDFQMGIQTIPKMNSSENWTNEEALMLRTYEKRFFLLREVTETFLQPFKELQHAHNSSQPIRFRGRIHTRHFFPVCFLLETIFCHQ